MVAHFTDEEAEAQKTFLLEITQVAHGPERTALCYNLMVCCHPQSQASYECTSR